MSDIQCELMKKFNRIKYEHIIKIDLNQIGFHPVSHFLPLFLLFYFRFSLYSKMRRRRTTKTKINKYSEISFVVVAFILFFAFHSYF